MYPCTKCQSIRKTSDFATKFAQKNMNDKNFEKINVKVIINIAMYPCTKFKLFQRTQILGPNLPPKKYE